MAQRSRVMVAGLAAVAVIAAGTWYVKGRTPPPPPPPPGGAVGDSAFHPECDLPGRTFQNIRRERIGASFAMSWPTWSVPGYHDAQKFVDVPNGTYGPLACVAARPDLATVDSARLLEGEVVGVIFVNDGGTLTQAYHALKLMAPGFYCIRLRGNIAQPTIDAWVLPMSGSSCATPSPTTKLVAHVRQVPGVPPAEYPPVARWVTKNSWRPGIGIRCGTRWCNIGVPPAEMRPPAHTIPATGSPGYIRRAVLGWHDQQEIAVRVGTNLQARFRASVVPVDGLGALEDHHFAADTVVHVANVYFADDPAGSKYASAWGFHVGDNQVGLKNVGGTWQVFVNGATTPRPNLRVNWRSNHAAIGYARWAWKEHDEGIWIRCAQGCCEIEDF